MSSAHPQERQPDLLWQANEEDVGQNAFDNNADGTVPRAGLVDIWSAPAVNSAGNSSCPMGVPSRSNSYFVNVDVSADAPQDVNSAGLAYTYAAGGSESGTSSPASIAASKKGKNDKYESKFRIGLQSFKEKVGAERWKSMFGEQAGFQVTRLPEVDAAVQKIKSMEAYYQGLEKVLSAYSKALKSVGDVQGELARYWLEQGYKETGELLRVPQIELGNADQAVSKEVLQYQAVVDNVRSAISTMLKSALADAAETAKKQESARQEMDGFASKLQTVMEKSQEKANKAGKALIEMQKETKEIEQAKAQFDVAKEKYNRLTIQLLDKAGMLDAKRAADIPEQIGALSKSGFNCYSASHQAYQLLGSESG